MSDPPTIRGAPAALLAWMLVGVSRTLAPRHPAAVEAVYARRVYPVIARAMALVTGALPFSLAEATVVLVLGALPWLLVRAWRRRRRDGRGLLRALVRLLGAAGLAVVVFDVAWGFNYDREPVAALLGYQTAPAPADDLVRLASALLLEAAEARRGLPEDGEGAMRLADGRGRALARAPLGYAGPDLHGLPMPRVGGRPKEIVLSSLMSYLGIAGIFIPFTGEANVNATLPDCEIPFTACHELAHQRGYAREDEANYVGYLACRRHPDRDFQYAGTFQAALYVLSALAGADRPAYARLRSGLAPPLRRDLLALARWNARYESRLGRVQERVNDTYLKTQGQAEGVRSYGRMVDLLLAERRAGAAPAGPQP